MNIPILAVYDSQGNEIQIPAIKGADGQDGADGKSAYESAQDGGYTGTEAQFNTDLADVGEKIGEAPNDGQQYARKNNAWAVVQGGDGTWGSITGTLANQTDLQNALNGKVDTSAYNPSAKIDAQTQAVGVDAQGRLWTIPGDGSGQVTSVNGMTGTVELDAEDVNAAPLNEFHAIFNPTSMSVTPSAVSSKSWKIVDGIAVRIDTSTNNRSIEPVDVSKAYKSISYTVPKCGSTYSPVIITDVNFNVLASVPTPGYELELTGSINVPEGAKYFLSNFWVYPPSISWTDMEISTFGDKVDKTDYSPVAKNPLMTEEVGKDENGKLWTASSEGRLPKDIVYTSETTGNMTWTTGYWWQITDGVASKVGPHGSYTGIDAIDISQFYKLDVKRENGLSSLPDTIITDENYNVLYTAISNSNDVDGIILPEGSKYLLINVYIITRDAAKKIYYIGYTRNEVLSDSRYLENADMFAASLRSHLSTIRCADKFEYKSYSVQMGKIAQRTTSGNSKSIVMDVVAGEKYWYSGDIRGLNPSPDPRVIFTDADGSIVSYIALSQSDTAIHEFSIPYGAEKVYVNLWETDANINGGYFIKYSCFPLHSMNVAVLGDSISTNGNTGIDANVPEITITEADIGTELSAYVTYYDVQAGLTLGGTTFTSADIGTEVTFTPIADDVGKSIGMPNNKNDNSLNVWWEHVKEHFRCNIIPVCWSGASITSHEANDSTLKTAHAWHDAQIRKCGIRVPGTMTRKAPDYIIIYRGCNDMTHEPYAVLTDDYFDGVNYAYPVTDDTVTVSGTTKYGYKEGYALTIKKLRVAYPNAKIILCTMAEYKRINYSQFPTNNGLYTLPKFNNAIREIADYFGCSVIEFDKCGITFENVRTYAGDDVHPNNQGHALMGAKAINDLNKIV